MDNEICLGSSNCCIFAEEERKIPSGWIHVPGIYNTAISHKTTPYTSTVTYINMLSAVIMCEILETEMQWWVVNKSI